MARACFVLFMTTSVLMQAFCFPTNVKVQRRDTSDNQVGNKASAAIDDIADFTDNKSPSAVEAETATTSTDGDDFDDDDDDVKPSTTSNGGGSSISSLFNLASALLPSLSGSNNTQRSGESSSSSLQPFTALKMDIFRALLQFGTSLIGLASSANASGS